MHMHMQPATVAVAKLVCVDLRLGSRGPPGCPAASFCILAFGFRFSDFARDGPLARGVSSSWSSSIMAD